MRRTLKWLLVFALVLTSSFAAVQHWRNSLQRGDREGWWEGSETARTAREDPVRGTPVPSWTNHLGLTRDVFAFTRVRYTRLDENRVSWRGGYWYSDMPDSDLNLSFRLQQLTSWKTDPDGRIIDLNSPELFDYPFIYMVEPGLMTLEDDEVPALRRYLLNGGFLMVDDFWGEPQWANFEREMKRVFPERNFSEVETNHPLFSVVFPMARPKEQLQVPNVRVGRDAERTGITWEVHQGEVCKDLHFRALFDDKNRLMVLACFNTDFGDGWDREGEDEYFFRRFAEGISYPMAINILFYIMTH
jgi:hypothetical protein